MWLCRGIELLVRGLRVRPARSCCGEILAILQQQRLEEWRWGWSLHVCEGFLRLKGGGIDAFEGRPPGAEMWGTQSLGVGVKLSGGPRKAMVDERLDSSLLRPVGVVDM